MVKSTVANSQHRIIMILKSLGIPMDCVDISAPGMEDHRDTMRASAKKKEGQRHALPPQIFNGEKYCGDYDDFDVANEDDELEEFLGIPRKTPKAVKGEPEEEKKEGEEAVKGEEEKKEGEEKKEEGEAAPAAEGEAAPAAEGEAAPAEEPAPAE